MGAAAEARNETFTGDVLVVETDIWLATTMSNIKNNQIGVEATESTSVIASLSTIMLLSLRIFVVLLRRACHAVHRGLWLPQHAESRVQKWSQSFAKSATLAMVQQPRSCVVMLNQRYVQGAVSTRRSGLILLIP